MIGPADVRRWAKQQFPLYLTSIVRGETFFPQRKTQIGQVPANATLEQFRDAVIPLWNASKAVTGFGYTVVLEKRNRRSRLEQNEPTAVEFESERDYLAFLSCEGIITAFRDNLHLILDAFPTVAPALAARPEVISEENGHWLGIIEVVRCFVRRPRPNCYMRALPVPVHTKFVESHKAGIELLLTALPETRYDPEGKTFQARCGLKEEPPVIRLRFIDGSLQVRCGFPVDDVALQVLAAGELQIPASARVIICENKMNFLAIPPMPNTIVIWGGGGAAISLIPQLHWIVQLPVLYWGDMDPSGFFILAELRARLPQVRSCNMDEQTLRSNAQNLRPAKKAVARVRTKHLSADEAAALELLLDPPKGIEQEQLTFMECVGKLNAALLSHG